MLIASNLPKINVEHTADWWLGNLDDHWFESLESAVREEWGEEPLRIREGGVCPHNVLVLLYSPHYSSLSPLCPI